MYRLHELGPEWKNPAKQVRNVQKAQRALKGVRGLPKKSKKAIAKREKYKEQVHLLFDALRQAMGFNQQKEH